MTTNLNLIPEVNYTKEFIQSILAYFSYVNMDGSKDKDIEWDNLKDVDLSDTLGNIRFLDNFNKYLRKKYDQNDAANEYANSEFILQFFMNNFIIKNQLVTRGFDGFAATTFELKNDLPLYGYVSGDTFLVYRGTEADDLGDWATDLFLTFSDKTGDSVYHRKFYELFNHMSQETQGIKYLQELIDTLNTNPDGTTLAIPRQIYIAGHSLGGYLSARSLLSLKEKNEIEGVPDSGAKYVLKYVKSVTTFNGAGLSVADGWLSSGEILKTIVKNFYSGRGLNVTSSSFIDMFKGTGTIISLFEHLGPRYDTVTENSGIIENHNMSLLMNSFGIFSTLETLITNYPTTINDIYDRVLTGENARLYAINQLIMNSSYLENDFGKSLSNIAQKIIEGFGLNLDYNSSIATFMGLKEYFTSHPELKLSVHNNFKNIGLTDSNSNRSSFYSLMNDLSYVLITPELYNKGIFKRDEKNELYNIENYNQEYLIIRTIYNKAVTELMERKLMQVLPYYIDVPELITYDSNGKYAFIVETSIYDKIFIDKKEIKDSLNGSAYQRGLFINSNEDDVDNGLVKYIYMKTNQKQVLNIFKDNSIVFDSALNDTLNIYSNNNIIRSMHGIDHINLYNHRIDLTNLTNNKIVISEKSDIVYIENRSINLDSLTVIFENETTDLEIKMVGVSKDFSNNKAIIRNGNQTIEISGVFNLNLNESVLLYKNIYTIMSNFPEFFENRGFNVDTIIDEDFVNIYMSLIKNKFNDGITLPENKISNRFSEYMITKLQKYSLESNVDTTIFQTYIASIVFNSELKATFNNEIKDIINQTTISIENIPIKDFVYSQLNNFADLKYNSLNTIERQKNPNNENYFLDAIDGVYYQKGTKNYNSVDTENGIKYVWDGIYYYDRVDENGNMIAAFYGNTRAGVDYKKYLKENLFIKNEILSENSSNIIYGSDGSDIMIGSVVHGQSLYFFDNNNVVDSDPKLRNNGNDILIGSNVSTYSGNNLILSNSVRSSLKGGRGSDLIIAKDKDSMIIANQNETLNSSADTHNILILLNNGNVFSSELKNTIYSNDGAVFATGGDTVYMNRGILYSYELSENEQEYVKQKESLSFFKDGLSFNYNDNGTGFNFYDKYKTNEKVNTIYEYGGVKAYLKKYDVIYSIESEIESESSIFGLGNNLFEINAPHRIIYSGGDSLLNINTIDSSFHFGFNDVYKIIFSQNNSFYARGLKDNKESELSSDNYTVTGIKNNLYIGNSNYNINLSGYETTLIYTKDSTLNNNIIINEIGVTNIKIEKNNIEKITIIASNDFKIANNFNDGKIGFLDINANTGFSESNKNILFGTIKIDEIKLKADDFIGVEFNNEISSCYLENIKINGTIKNNKIFKLKGFVDQLILLNEGSSTKVNIDGFINYLNLSNVNEFSYLKSFNNHLHSDISIYLSSLETIYGMNNYDLINLRIEKSTLKELILKNVTSSNFSFTELNMEKLSINNLKESNLELSYENINEIYISKYKGSKISISGKSTSLKTNINGLEITGENLDFFYIYNLGFDEEFAKLNFGLSDFENLNIKLNAQTDLILSSSNGIINISDGALHGSLTKLNVLNLSKITKTTAFIYDIKTINLDIDSLLNIPILTNVSNINLITKVDIIITKSMIGGFEFNDSYIGNYTLTAFDKTFTKNEIDQIRGNLINSNSYAIITQSNIEYIHPETEPELPYIDDNNIYQGTSKNDTFDLNDPNIAYKINGNGGDDTFNFSGENYMFNIINYKSGDGLGVVNVNGYVTLSLNLNMFSIIDLSFTIENDINNIPTTFNIFKNGIQIFKLNNYQNISLMLMTTEKTYQGYEIIKLMSTINGTDGNDIINGTDKINYIYAGKGTDIINLIGSDKNEIYYKKDDGHKTVNAPNTKYTVIFEYTIDPANITYQLIGYNSFNILLNNEIIIAVNEADKAILQYLLTYQTIEGTEILSNLNI